MAILLFLKKYWKVIAFVALIVGSGYTGWHMRGTHDAAALVAQVKKADQIRETLAAKQSQVEDKNAKQKVKIVTRTQVVYRRIASFPDGMCLNDPRMHDFSSIWNEAAGHADKHDAAVRKAGVAEAKPQPQGHPGSTRPGHADDGQLQGRS